MNINTAQATILSAIIGGVFSLLGVVVSWVLNQKSREGKERPSIWKPEGVYRKRRNISIGRKVVIWVSSGVLVGGMIGYAFGRSTNNMIHLGDSPSSLTPTVNMGPTSFLPSPTLTPTVVTPTMSMATSTLALTMEARKEIVFPSFSNDCISGKVWSSFVPVTTRGEDECLWLDSWGIFGIDQGFTFR